MNHSSSKFLGWLLGIYAVLFVVLAIHPVDKQTWFVENLTVWIILSIILILYACKVRFSKTAYALIELVFFIKFNL